MENEQKDDARIKQLSEDLRILIGQNIEYSVKQKDDEESFDTAVKKFQKVIEDKERDAFNIKP